MSLETITTAFAAVPASTEKTAITTDLTALWNEISTTQAAGAFSTTVEGQLQEMVVDLAERIAMEMIEHS